jgi:gamma-butyrobetaine dioxygenase
VTGSAADSGLGLPAVWLRHNCPCSDCQDPVTGQRLAQAEAAYAAYRTWAALTARPEFLLTLRLAPGDCLVFDNTRVLHARTAFAAGGGAPASASTPAERHLQGCYADIDGLLSTLAVLRR